MRITIAKGSQEQQEPPVLGTVSNSGYKLASKTCSNAKSLAVAVKYTPAPKSKLGILLSKENG